MKVFTLLDRECFVLGSLILFDLLVHQREPKGDNSNGDVDVAAGNSDHSNVTAASTASSPALETKISEGATGQVEVWVLVGQL